MSFDVNMFLGSPPRGECQRVEGIDETESFRDRLARERADCEARGKPCAVLAYRTSRLRLSRSAAGAFVRSLNGNLSPGARVGWLDAKTIGVLLPDTKHDAAAAIARSVGGTSGGPASRLACTIYASPLGAENGDDKAGSASSPAAAGVPEPLVNLCAMPMPLWKRAEDIVFSLIGLVLAGPLMLVIAALIKSVSPGPVFFKQERVGYLGRRFVLYKFRSMRMNADSAVHKDYLSDLIKSGKVMKKLDQADRRIIPMGRILRASGLDELPQILNVLRGDMSLVGPRPCTPYEYRDYEWWHKWRCDVHPGLTGLWQVSGKNKTTFAEMIRLDVVYSRRRSLLRDMHIMLRTVPSVVKQVIES